MVVISILAAILLAEWILSTRAQGSLTIPFYNRLYPYVMFRPHENTRFISHDVKLASNIMSRNKRVVHHFTNQDGLRVEALDYDLPQTKTRWRMARSGTGVVGGAVGNDLQRLPAGRLADRAARALP